MRRPYSEVLRARIVNVLPACANLSNSLPRHSDFIRNFLTICAPFRSRYDRNIAGNAFRNLRPHACYSRARSPLLFTAFCVGGSPHRPLFLDVGFVRHRKAAKSLRSAKHRVARRSQPLGNRGSWHSRRFKCLQSPVPLGGPKASAYSPHARPKSELPSTVNH
jgi:hypothetical protein